MKEWDPKSVWDELRKTLRSWSGEKDEEDERQTIDTSLLFHLMLTVPLLLALLSLAKR
jgi:hypothetical protein